MLSEFKTYLTAHEWDKKDQRFLLGVSGGVDSVVMTHLFYQTKLNFALAHCNFKLRTNDADKDEAFVRKLSEKFNVPFYTTSFDTKKHAKENGISTQMAARELRFQWFETLAQENDFDYIAIASHIDDAIETCFINLTKGTGIKGLHGILPQQEKVIHPMLFCDKKDILNYAQKNNIKFRKDLSNEKDDYVRNKIRHHVIPVLKEVNPALKDSMTAFFSRIQYYETIIQEQFEIFKKQCITPNENEWLINIKKAIHFSGLSVFLYEFLFPFGFQSKQIHQIEKMLFGHSGKIIESRAYQVLKNRTFLILRPKKENAKTSLIISGAGKYTFNTFQIEVKTNVTFKKLNTDKKTAQLNSDLLQFPLLLRKWQDGDRFQPLGMKGKKKLSDFLIDEKLSVFEKENTFVLMSGNEIVWVVGHRISEKFKITAQTTQCHVFKIQTI
jgi:tRNA(Ile)-lysidine synthase